MTLFWKDLKGTTFAKLDLWYSFNTFLVLYDSMVSFVRFRRSSFRKTILAIQIWQSLFGFVCSGGPRPFHFWWRRNVKKWHRVRPEEVLLFSPVHSSPTFINNMAEKNTFHCSINDTNRQTNICKMQNCLWAILVNSLTDQARCNHPWSPWWQHWWPHSSGAC